MADDPSSEDPSPRDLPDRDLSDRDFVGYAGAPPNADWPAGARLAVNFCINYEEGAERNILDGDGGPETRLTDDYAQPRPGARNLYTESAYEYGARVGFWRIMQAFQDRQLNATVNLVGLAGEKNPKVLEAIAESGFDINCHGWRWIDYHGMSEDAEREHIRKCVDQAVRVTGRHPEGYYAGLPSMNTRRLVVEEGGFLYSSDAYNDDLPYWDRSFDPPHLVIPYTLDTNDSRFSSMVRYQTADQYVTYLKDSIDCLLAEGRGGAPKMLTVGLHGRLIGRPGRIVALHRVLDYLQTLDHVWVTRRADIARHWMAEHSAQS